MGCAAACASLCRLPVFVDLIWERHRSPLVAALTTIRLLVFFYLVVAATFGVDSSGTCTTVAGGTEDATLGNAKDAFLFIFTVSAALASARANSAMWVLVALPAGAVYVNLLGFGFMPCITLMKANYGAANGITVIVRETLDIASSMLIVLALIPTAMRLKAGMSEAMGLRSTQYLLAETPARGLVAKICRGALVAPLRHNIAVVLAFIFCIVGTIVGNAVGTHLQIVMIQDYWNPFVDSFNAVVDTFDKWPPPSDPSSPEAYVYDAVESLLGRAPSIINNVGYIALQVSLDMLTALTYGASVSCVVVLISMSLSYKILYDDNLALAAVLCADPASQALLGGEEGLLAGASKGAFTVTVDFEGAAPRTPRSCGERLCPRCFGAGPRIFLNGTHGTPDVASTVFSYTQAFNYTSLYAINIVTVWALLTILFGLILFAFFSDALSSTSITALATALGTYAYTWVLGWCIRRCVADGNSVKRPRVLLLLDLFLSITLGALAGVTSGFIRFLLGTVWLMFSMTLLGRPVLPGALATFDSGFLAYAGMLKGSWAWALHPGSWPTEPTDAALLKAPSESDAAFTGLGAA